MSVRLGTQNYVTLLPFMQSLIDGTAELNLVSQATAEAKTVQTSTSVPAAESPSTVEESPASETPSNVVETEATTPQEAAGAIDVEEPTHVEEDSPMAEAMVSDSYEEPAPVETVDAEVNEATEGSGPAEHVKDEL